MWEVEAVLHCGSGLPQSLADSLLRNDGLRRQRVQVVSNTSLPETGCGARNDGSGEYYNPNTNPPRRGCGAPNCQTAYDVLLACRLSGIVSAYQLGFDLVTFFSAEHGVD